MPHFKVNDTGPEGVISIGLSTRFLEPDCQGPKPISAIFTVFLSISSSLKWEEL